MSKLKYVSPQVYQNGFQATQNFLRHRLVCLPLLSDVANQNCRRKTIPWRALFLHFEGTGVEFLCHNFFTRARTDMTDIPINSLGNSASDRAPRAAFGPSFTYFMVGYRCSDGKK